MLQNTQPFIFLLICMQLCKCLNCFLKSHNKQLNQYCLNFIIFLTKKKVLKNGSSHKLGWPEKQRSSNGSTVFAPNKENRVRIGYFSGRVRKFWHILSCLIHTRVALYLKGYFVFILPSLDSTTNLNGKKSFLFNFCLTKIY